MRHAWMIAGALLLAPRCAFAHSGAHGPQDLLRTWTLEPGVLALMLVLIAGYALGSRRGQHRRAPVPAWRARCHWLGVLALLLALVSPIDALGELLFSGHMMQHLLLTMVAAPLLVLGDGGLVILRALPLRARRAVGHVLRHPLVRRSWRALAAPIVAWTLHTFTLLAWHLPGPYELAVRNDAVHALEHATFLVTALLFWWVVAAPRRRARMGFGAAVFYLFTAATVAGVLGASIALSNTPWYSVHERWTAAWGLTPLDDQQLAGLIMWIPAGFLYLIAIAPLVIGALRHSTPRAAQSAQRAA